MQETERLSRFRLVSVEGALVQLQVLQIRNLSVDGVDLLLNLRLKRIISSLVVGFEGGDHGLEGVDLGIQVGGGLHSQIIHLLVNVLDVDFVVGTSSSQQCDSGEEQRCEFREFDFHKVGMELKVN